MFRAMSLGCLPRAQAACQKEVVAPSPKCMSRTREWHDGGGPGCGAHPPGFDSPREHRVSHWGFILRICFPQVLDISRGATMGLRRARRLQGSVRLW